MFSRIGKKNGLGEIGVKKSEFGSDVGTPTKPESSTRTSL